MNKFYNKVIFSAILLYASLLVAQTVNVFPKFLTGLDAAKPSQCDVPSFYQATDTNNLYVCNAGFWQLVIGGSATTASVSPDAIPFGTVQSGTTSGTKNLTISNTGGSGSFTVTGISFIVPTGSPYPSSDFSGPNLSACNISIPAGGHCDLPLTAHPSTNGLETATAVITTTAPLDPQSPLISALTVTGTPAVTFPVSLSGLGLGSATVSDGTNTTTFSAGQCSGGCIVNYPTGTTINYQVTPATGSIFSSVTGAGLSTGNLTFTVTQSQSIVFTFDLTTPDVTLTLAGSGQGGGSVVDDVASTNGLGILSCTSVAGVTTSAGTSGCNGTFAPGTSVVLTPTANSTSVFGSWSGAPNCNVSPTCTVVLNSSLTVTVNFSPNSSTVQISLIQASTNCSVAGTTIDCLWSSAQQIGDINVCAGTISDNTTTVSSMVDTGGNTYTQVPTVSPKPTTGLNQVVYYAQNISAASAGVRHTTMTLSTSAASSVVATALTGGHTGGSGSPTYTSGSVTFPNNHLILATTWAQLSSGNGPGPLSTLTGGGITWVLVQVRNVGPLQGTGTTTRIEVWRALGTGGTGALTATWATFPVARGMAISEFGGIDLTGSNGSGAIGSNPVPTNTGSGTNSSVTMGTFGSAGNGTFGVTGTTSSQSRTAGAGMTQLNNDGEMGDEWAAGNIANVQQTMGASVAWGSIGIEIKAAGSTGRRDMRCLEYAGVKQSGSPIDVSAAAVGSSTTPASGSLTTGTAGDLLTGFTASLSSVNTSSTSFMQQVKNTFGDDEEDRQGVAVGSYNFQPTLTSSANWVATQIAWLAQSSSAPTVFSLQLFGGGNGFGSVTGSAGTPPINGTIATGSCTGPCSSQVNVNNSVTLTAITQVGSVFIGWTGVNGCSTSTICIVPNITANQNITANFALSGQLQYFVDHASGNDANSGLCSAAVTGCTGPWRTIAKSASSATIGAIGTVVNIVPATYNETVNINRGGNSPTARLIFKCTGQWTVGGSTGCEGVSFFVNAANNVDIGAVGKLGFTFTNASATTAVDVIWQCGTTATTCTSGNSIHVLGNYFHDIGQSVSNGCPFGAAIEIPNQHGKFVSDTLVDGNLVDHYGVYPNTTCNSAQGIYVLSDGGTVRNNIVTRSADGAIQYYDRACNATIANNDLLNNRVGLIFYGGNGCTPGLNNAINNVIDFNQIGFLNGFSGANDCVTGRNILISNNTMFGNGTDFQQPQPACEIRQNTLSENPTVTFVNYTGDATGNYALKPTSTAVNGGTFQCVTGQSCAPGRDFLNVVRPQRQTIDRGALELP